MKKEEKGQKISTYQLVGTLVLDTQLATVYICVDHTYLLFLVLDHLGLHLEHILDQHQFAHLNPYSALLLCFRIVFLRHHILPSKLHFHFSFAGFLFTITPHSIVVYLALHLRHL
jgi:hypothetical protein